MKNLFEPQPEASKSRDSGTTKSYLQGSSLERFCVRSLSVPSPTNS